MIESLGAKEILTMKQHEPVQLNYQVPSMLEFHQVYVQKIPGRSDRCV